MEPVPVYRCGYAAAVAADHRCAGATIVSALPHVHPDAAYRDAVRPLLAALVSAIAYAVFKHLPLLRTADAVAPAALLLQSSLHVGSLFAGDDLGSPTSAWMGHLIRGDRGFHPVALYAALLSLLSTGAAFVFLQRERQAGETSRSCVGACCAGSFLYRPTASRLCAARGDGWFSSARPGGPNCVNCWRNVFLLPARCSSCPVKT